MKWLKLDCDFPDDPKIKCLAREWGGETAAAFWTLLLALVGKYGGTECSVRIDNAGQFSEAFIASRLSSKPQVTLRRLSRAAHLGLIDTERWKNHREIFLPNMLKRIDDYTRKVRTKSVHSPDTPPKSRTVELEEEVDKEKKNTGGRAPAQSSRPPDEAFETFVEIFNEDRKPAKYPREDPGGFVQLAKLRKAQGIPHSASPPEWRRACLNYLSSPREKHTLADLCSHYSTFVHSEVDRYGKPVGAGKRNGWEGVVKPAEAVVPHKGSIHRCIFCSGGPHDWKCDLEHCDLPSVAPCRHYIETKRGKNEKSNQARV